MTKHLLNILEDNRQVKTPICNLYSSYQLVESLTYKDIIKKSKEYAVFFKNNIVGERKPVLISLETSAEFIYSFFGLLYANQIPVPVSSATLMLTKDYQDLIGNIAQSCCAQFIVTDQDILHKIKRFSPEYIENVDLNSSVSIPKVQENDTCFIQFSSGSTRQPEGVCVSFKNIISNLEQIYDAFHPNENDRVCSWLPLHHDMGLIGILLGSLYNKTPSYLLSPVDFIASTKQWLQLLSNEKISIICAPNSAYSSCVKKIKPNHLKHLDLSHIRVAMSGAEPVNAKVCEAFSEYFHLSGFNRNTFLPVYGLAEATLAVSFPKPEGDLKVLSANYEDLTRNNRFKKDNSDSSIQVVSCGKPLNQTKIEIRNEDGLPLKENRIGLIHVKGSSVSRHYYQSPSHLVDGWLNTGDLGFIHQEELYITGREKDLIIINGRNIAAHDVEVKAAELIDIKMGRIVAFSYICPKENKEKLHIVAECCLVAKKNRTSLKEQIAHKVQEIATINVNDISLIPPLLIKKTTSGKVKRQLTKKLFLNKCIAKWEKRFLSLYIRSELIVFKFRVILPFRFIIQKIKSRTLHVRPTTKKEEKITLRETNRRTSQKSVSKSYNDAI